MNRINLVVYGILLSIFLIGCSQILEPVSLYKNLEQSALNEQEEFLIDIRPLTFSSAKIANQDTYPRTIMRTGSGPKANIFTEANFLNIQYPKLPEKSEYLIGVGDYLSFLNLDEFLNDAPKLPIQSSPAEYLIGAGDKLNFLQLNDPTKDISIIGNDGVLKTEGIVGTGGSILLLGLGNINVGGRSLDDVRTEVRNILIRNGLAPNFQLEISEFGSKKAYVVIDDNELSTVSKTIIINNIPTALHEVALDAGISSASKRHALITLMRGSKSYKFTAEQLFKLSTPKIFIKDNDQINIKIVKNLANKVYKSIVGSQGNIFLDGVGIIKAEGQTLEKLRREVAKILTNKGFGSNFLLEITEFNSKKVYLIQQTKNKVISLTSKGMSIRELILNNKDKAPKDALEIYTLWRGNKKYQMTSEQILDTKNSDIWIQDGDQIKIETFNYKPGHVFALGGTGSAKIIPIKPSKRETLADVLFKPNGALTNQYAQRSEVYLLRGRSPSTAYHLDTQNVSRLLVAAETELRPNDIVFVADRPIVSFTRALSELNPLRTLLRDIKNNDIP